jgi:hypothetical protein
MLACSRKNHLSQPMLVRSQPFGPHGSGRGIAARRVARCMAHDNKVPGRGEIPPLSALPITGWSPRLNELTVHRLFGSWVHFRRRYVATYYLH